MRVPASVVLVALLSTGLVVGLADGTVRPDEDRVELQLDPGRVDAVTVYFVDDGGDPTARAESLLTDAGLPVHDVAVERVDDPITVRYDDRVVDGGETYAKVTVATSLGEHRGAFRREVPAETVRAISPTRSPDVSVETPRGMTVVPSESGSPAGLFAQRHDVGGATGIAYGVTADAFARAIGGLVTVALAAFVPFRRYARRLAAADEPAENRLHRLEGVEMAWLMLTVAIAFLLALWAGAPAIVSLLAGTLLPATPTGAWWGVTLRFAAVVPFVAAVWFAVSLASHPVRRTLRESERTRLTTLRWRARSLLVPVAGFWIAAVVVVALPAGIATNPAALALVVGGLSVAHTAAAPLLIQVFADVSPMPGSLREEVDRLCDARGVDVRKRYLIDAGSGWEANAVVAGLPGSRSLFLTEELVGTLSPAGRRAIVAHELGHAVRRHLLKRAGFAVAFWFVGLVVAGVVFSTGAIAILFLAGCYLGAGKGWIGHRQEYEADAYAASVTDVETTVSALGRLAEANATPRRTARWYDLAVAHPSIDDRIDRLRDAAGSGAPGEPGDDAEAAVDTGADPGATADREADSDAAVD